MSTVANKRMRYAPLAVAGLLLPAVLSAGIADYSSGLLRHVAGKWGEDGQQRVLELQQLVRKQKTPSANPVQPERNRLFPGNTFWNRIPYVNDREHWGKDDYWATPVETAGSNGGDCEDFSIGKYFTLKESGVPLQKLRITYVRARNQAESHMVLAYYPEPDAEPLILDNLVDEILPASKRPDLDPVFSFNDEDVWIEGGTPAKSGSSSHIRLWRELLDKMSREQSL